MQDTPEYIRRSVVIAVTRRAERGIELSAHLMHDDAEPDTVRWLCGLGGPYTQTLEELNSVVEAMIDTMLNQVVGLQQAIW